MKKLFSILLIFVAWMMLFSADTDDELCTKKEEDPCENPITPIASFTWDRSEIYPGDIVNFSYTGTDDPTAYSWNFHVSANPLTADTRFVSVIFTTAGTREVTLRVKGECAWSSTKMKSVVVRPFPEGRAGHVIPADTNNVLILTP
ncbi:MAG TPA: PKD domain-containing protein [Bacteroidales bacterium]|nr:PKD domain-containing protein [Bacteroidales bacterium]HPI85384.1 PKD domain-containing protein [Bacteroidales bacterium]HPM91791.1 PKD domain-containing protein [Bacteroidales bacterium]